MYNEVNPEDPGFAPTRKALAATLGLTAAAAARYLIELRATQFERLRQAVEAAPNESQRAILVRLCLAETMAEDAHDKANAAAAAVGIVKNGQAPASTVGDLVDQADALSISAKTNAGAARELIAADNAAEAAAAAAKVESEAPATSPAADGQEAPATQADAADSPAVATEEQEPAKE